MYQAVAIDIVGLGGKTALEQKYRWDGNNNKIWLFIMRKWKVAVVMHLIYAGHTHTQCRFPHLTFTR